MKLLLLGAKGQVGWELARSLRPLGRVEAFDRAQADLSRLESLGRLVENVAPDVIVNAAAYTAVDRAEQEAGLAFLVNRDAPAVLAQAARGRGALFVHYSTDYVLDGTGTAPRDERSTTAPLNAYGRSKLAGEEAVRDDGGDWLVLRTSWVYAARGQNFLRTMLRLGAEREELKVVADQIGAPTSARLIADATAQIVSASLTERRQGQFVPEILNLCAAGETSWHGFAQAIFEGWRARRGEHALKVGEVVPITTVEYPTPARRPLNSRLDCRRLSERYGLVMPDWRIGVELALDELAA